VHAQHRRLHAHTADHGLEAARQLAASSSDTSVDVPPMSKPTARAKPARSARPRRADHAAAPDPRAARSGRGSARRR
jgi:hypothetical protein